MSNLILVKSQRERIIVETMMAADRLGEGNLINYLLELYYDSESNFGEATATFLRDNVGEGGAFSGVDYEGINWARVVGDLYTYFLPSLLWDDEKVDLDAELHELKSYYKYH